MNHPSRENSSRTDWPTDESTPFLTQNSQSLKPKHTNRGFWALIATQFQGAFSDNAYKFIVTYTAFKLAASEAEGNQNVSIVTALFTIPFLLFSMSGGFLADRYSKRSVTLGTKLAEIAIMLAATMALWFHNIPAAMALVFFTGAQAAFFGPSKYGLLPELLDESNLSWGNGILEMTTFVSIILGDVVGSFLWEGFHDNLYIAGGILVGLAIAGTAISFRITPVPPANAEARHRINFLGEVFHYLAIAKKDRILWLAVLGSTYFWFLGILLLTNVLIYGSQTLHLHATPIAILKAALCLGIGLGSFMAGHLSGHKIEYGLIPLGGVGVTVFLLALALPGWSFAQSLLLLVLLGFFSGFFIVPINALLQQRPDPKIKGSFLAMANLMTFVGMLIATGFFWLLTVKFHFSPLQIFLAGAILTFGATIVVIQLVPDSLMRFIFWVMTHTFYRVHALGRENIPPSGGAMIVANHLSFVDSMLLLASTDRFIRFLMDKDIYELPFIKPFAKMLRVIPISGRQNLRDLIRSLREASQTIQAGDVVCIFAEGQMTRIGQMLPFRKGFERIMRNVNAPIIPVHLDGIWESMFSYYKGRFFFKWPSAPLRPVTVTLPTVPPPI